jgi:uncharacterized membrane protein
MTGLWLLTALVLTGALTLAHSPLIPLPGVITMMILPGATVMSFIHARPANNSGRFVIAVSLSMLVIMVVGLAVSVVGPTVGIAHPLDAIPEDFIWTFLGVLMLVASSKRRQDPVAFIFEGIPSRQIYGVLASGLLVVPSILGAAQLNFSGNNHLAVCATVLDVSVLIAGIVGGWKRDSRWPLCSLLYGASLALLLSASLRGGHLYGWDIQQEFGVASQTISAGRWSIPANHDPYASMLSLTVLPAVLASLVKLRLLAFFQLVIPAILALLPVAVFTTVKSVPRWITALRPAPRPGLALAVVTALIVSSAAFSAELVSITRQAMALTMLTALVMVLFDRTILKRPSQIIVALLTVSISFTHYTTSYLLTVILVIAWPVSIIWSKGWLGTPRAKIEQHRYVVGTRKIINCVLVVVALTTSFGWNLVITRNFALTAASSAIVTKGAGLATSTGPNFISAPKLENVLESELHVSARYLVPVRGAASVKLVTINTPDSNASKSKLAHVWNWTNLVIDEGLWVLSGVALLYGLFRLGRRQANHFSPDLVGLAAAGFVIGGFLRFSSTLAAFYSPERAAIFTAILLAAPVTMFLDDLVEILKIRFVKFALALGVVVTGIMLVWATGLGTFFAGGAAPGSLSARGVNSQDFTVSTSELATATWIRNNAGPQGIVQTDEYGQLVMLSQPADYDLLTEFIPPEVDQRAFIYLSSLNLVDRITNVNADNGNLITTYRTNLSFFNRHFYIVYSTGSTRVYH